MARMIRWAILAALAAGAAPAPAQVGTWTIRGTGTGTGVSFGANAACNRTVSVTRRASRRRAHASPPLVCAVVRAGLRVR